MPRVLDSAGRPRSLVGGFRCAGGCGLWAPEREWPSVGDAVACPVCRHEYGPEDRARVAEARWLRVVRAGEDAESFRVDLNGERTR